VTRLVCQSFNHLIGVIFTQIPKTNKEERYSRVPRLSDTRYSAKWRYAISKARLKCATYRALEWAWQIFFGSIDRFWWEQYISVKIFILASKL